jgi:hypothetical protein
MPEIPDPILDGGGEHAYGPGDALPSIDPNAWGDLIGPRRALTEPGRVPVDHPLIRAVGYGKLRPKRLQYCILRHTRGCEWQVPMAYWSSPTTWFEIERTEHERLIAEHLVSAHNDDPHLRKYFI